MPAAYIALGSNLGDRRSHLDHALGRLGVLGRFGGGSPIYETDPVGGPEGQGAYLNSVVRIDTDLDPGALLASMLDIEAEQGRTRDVRWAARTLDLDLIWYDGATIEAEGLTVPHPRTRERAFVLAPITDVEPSLGDAIGAYADALDAVPVAGIRRVSGPVDGSGHRWMAGLAEALAVTGDGPYHCVAHPDWANTSKDAFGAFLAAVALASADRHAPEFQVLDLGYRFITPVPAGSDLVIDVTTVRSSSSSCDLEIRINVDGAVVGSCSISMVAGTPEPVRGPGMPRVMGRSKAIPADRLVRAAGRTPGASLRSWTPLERWDVPDLADGDVPVLRAWSPNVTAGWVESHLTAASILMPIDALIWPATLQARDELPSASHLSTPTIDLTVRYAALTAQPWYVAEASVDHLAGRSVAGTVRVWGADGTYAAVGHSLNLVLATPKPTDGL